MKLLHGGQRFTGEAHVGELKKIRKDRSECAAKHEKQALLPCEQDEREQDTKGRSVPIVSISVKRARSYFIGDAMLGFSEVDQIG